MEPVTFWFAVCISTYFMKFCTLLLSQDYYSLCTLMSLCIPLFYVILFSMLFIHQQGAHLFLLEPLSCLQEHNTASALVTSNDHIQCTCMAINFDHTLASFQVMNYNGIFFIEFLLPHTDFKITITPLSNCCVQKIACPLIIMLALH